MYVCITNIDLIDGNKELEEGSDLGWFEGVVWCESDVQEEHSSLIHWTWRTQDSGPPLINVVSFWAGTENKAQPVQCRKVELHLNIRLIQKYADYAILFSVT